MTVNRRDVLTAAAGLAALPAVGSLRALGQVPASGEVDVAIVGAGAAGIAAARRVASFRRTYALIEATERVGGRCMTDTAVFGVAYDMGAHWLHVPRKNPLVAIGKASGLAIYDAPNYQRLRIGNRDARDAEAEDFAGALSRANRAIATAGESPRDQPAARAIPDIGDHRATVSFMLGPFSCGKDLDEVSAIDFARSEERDEDAFCREGLGTILGLAAIDLAVQSSSPVTQIDWGGRQIALTTPRGTIRARTVIVTASTNVIAAGKIRFAPALPASFAGAVEKLTLGAYNHVALELVGNPLRLRDDEIVYFKTADAKTLALLGRVSGTDLALCDVGGRHARELEQAGEATMIDFAREHLVRHYGADFAKRIGRTHATRWGAQPWIMGAFSAAPPGAQPQRRALTQGFENRLFYAGEAAHETLWGTVAGAWLSGERAADQALRAVGVQVPVAAAPAPPPQPAGAPAAGRQQPRPPRTPPAGGPRPPAIIR